VAAPKGFGLKVLSGDFTAVFSMFSVVCVVDNPQIKQI
jgi:hypothetical protein